MPGSLSDCDKAVIDKAKLLVESRGNYAHANGQIEKDVNARIDEYLEILEHIQEKIHQVNNDIFEIEDSIKELDDVEEYFSEVFRDNQFSPKDFGSVILEILRSDLLTFEQWEQVISKGIDICYEDTIHVLKYLSENDYDEGRKFQAKEKLDSFA